MTAVVIAISPPALRDILDDAALSDAETIAAEALTAAHPDHTDETLRLAWTTFAEATRARNALDPVTGGAHWSEYYDSDDLGHPDAQETACQWKAIEADEAYGEIVNGPERAR